MTNEITIALPTDDRVRAYEFYRTALNLPSVGEPAEDGVPEPLQFRLDTGTTLMFVPTGGFGWVLGGRDSAPAGSHEILLASPWTPPRKSERRRNACSRPERRSCSNPPSSPGASPPWSRIRMVTRGS